MNSLLHSLAVGVGRLHIDFATPQVLWLLLFLPLWWVLRTLRKPPTITFSRADLIARGPRAGSLYPTVIFVLRNLLLISLIVTLARPRLVKHGSQVDTEGIDIALTVDLSSSMLARDFQPKDRLEVAKQSMRTFVLGRSSDRIGLIAFASEAMTQVPLTTDYPVLLQAINNLRVGQLDDGTAIGDAIATAANRLRNEPGKSRVLILMTDGVNNRGAVDPVTAARAALTYGIRIYSIGIGTKGMAMMPVGYDTDGTPQFAMQPVQVDEALLTKVAEMTGGEYFRAQNAGALQDIYQQINSMEKSAIRKSTPIHYADLFRWPLGSAVVLLLLELSLSAVRAPLP